MNGRTDEIVAGAWARAGADPEASRLALLLDAVSAFARRFVVFRSEHQAVAVALWVAHVYAIDAAARAAYLRIKSAVEESGKTTLLEVLALVLGESRAINAVSITPSAVFRIRDKEGPVALLLDEVDQTLRDRKDDGARDLLAMVNAGYRRGATAVRTVGRDFEARRFQVFGPAAIAGMATLSPATESRCIPIVLDRKRRGQGERWLSFLVEDKARALGDALAEWCADEVVAELRRATPSYPAELRDRQVEAWWPLFAIADLAGGAWPERARAAAVAVHGGADMEATLSTGVLLLAHIRDAFEEAAYDRMATATLLRALVANEEGPWGEWWGAEVERAAEKGVTPHGAASELARKLRPFDIGPKAVRIGDATPRGYRAEDFSEAWDKYLPATAATAATYLASPVAGVAPVAAGDREAAIRRVMETFPGTTIEP